MPGSPISSSMSVHRRKVVQMANDREQPRREGSAERSSAATDRLRGFYDRKAHSYDRWLAYYDRWMKVGESRHRLLSRARGQTLEVGAGTGVNLPHYMAAASPT
jgi:hypothetical protein